MSMTNETAIITGSTSGIGKKIAELFLEENCKVTICSRSKKHVDETVSEFQKNYEGSVIGYACDVTKVDEIKSMIESTVKNFGTIRILVANAGLNTTFGPLEYLTPERVYEDAQIVIGVNLIGMINSVTAVLPYMINQNYGRIITIAGAGVSRPTPNMTLYSASKGGVVTFSKCLAEELNERDYDIKINIFFPGMIDTNLGINTKVIKSWKDDKTFRREQSIVLAHIGTDINESCKKVIKYVLPSCKDTGKEFRGFSLFKMIYRGRKLQKSLKEARLM